MGKHGIAHQLTLPDRGFNRNIGAWSTFRVAPEGRIIDQEEWDRHYRDWLPTDEDHVFITSLMQRVVDPGKMATWIAPPARGIHSKPLDYEYVKFG